MSLLNCHLYGLPKLDKRAASASPRRTVLTCINCVPTGVISPLHVHHFHPSPMKVLPSIVSSNNKATNGPTPFICLGCKWKPQKTGQTSVATNSGSGFWGTRPEGLSWKVAQAHDQRNHEIDHLIRSIGHYEAGSLYKFGMPNHGNKKSGLFINSYSIFMISATSILTSSLLHSKPPLAPSKTAGLRNRSCKKVTLKSLNMMDQ